MKDSLGTSSSNGWHARLAPYALQVGELEDVPRQSPRIEDRTRVADKSQRKGRRPASTVDALVLHQMACCRTRREGGYDRIGSHFAILADGRILQLHPVEALVYASNGFNRRSVAVEFAGNFPNTRGRCWNEKEHGCQQLTQAQIDAGRYLIDHLRKTIPLKYIFAHRQSSASRENDPGPDIWYQVGQWAIDRYGLSDGGPGYHLTYSASTKARIRGLGDGRPIPEDWRTWGRRPGASVPAAGSTSGSTPSSTPAARQPAARGSDLGFLTGLLGIPTAIVEALQRGQEYLGIRLAIARGQRDVNFLTNMVFFARYPARQGKKLVKGEPGFQRLAGEWLGIRDRLVKPVLQASSNAGRPAGTAANTPVGAPPLNGPREPGGYRAVVRSIQGRRLKRGLARYGGERVDKTLRALRARGAVQVTDEEIDVFQRIANVETGGLIQGLNTWDSAVVSIGFMQWTLLYGELQEWISRVPGVFRRYGIELEPSRKYAWKGNRQKAIKGAAMPDELRWDGWAQRFYLAGLDPDIIAAEVQLARQVLQRHLDRLKRRLQGSGTPADYDLFLRHYRRSPAIRGLFQEAYNNLPAAALNGTLAALRSAKAEGNVSTERFLALLQGAIRQAYRDRNDNGENVIQKTLRGAQ